jgi:hypothetical protein
MTTTPFTVHSHVNMSITVDVDPAADIRATERFGSNRTFQVRRVRFAASSPDFMVRFMQARGIGVKADGRVGLATVQTATVTGVPAELTEAAFEERDRLLAEIAEGR